MRTRVKQLTETLNKQSEESLQGQKSALECFPRTQFTLIKGTNWALWFLCISLIIIKPLTSENRASLCGASPFGSRAEQSKGWKKGEQRQNGPLHSRETSVLNNQTDNKSQTSSTLTASQAPPFSAALLSLK